MYSNKAEIANWDIYDDLKLEKKLFGLHGLYENISASDRQGANLIYQTILRRISWPSLVRNYYVHKCDLKFHSFSHSFLSLMCELI